MKHNLRQIICTVGLILMIFLPQTPAFSAGFSQSNEKALLNQAPDLNPHVLDLGLRAFSHVREKGFGHKDYLTIIDYSKPSTEKRLWVIDLDRNTVLFDTFVAHGKDSGDNYANHFSNQSHSFSSSIGVYLTGDTYEGKNGHSLRLYGLEAGFNDNAFRRAIVMHPAWYVSPSFLRDHGRLGRSWGCPAISEAEAPEIIKTIKQGSVVLAYYPDKNWLNNSQYV